MVDREALRELEKITEKYETAEAAESGMSGIYGIGVPELIILIPLLVFVFIPTIVAKIRRHEKLWGIFLLNLLTCWTLIGWIAAFIWAWIDPKPDNTTTNQQPNREKEDIKERQEGYYVRAYDEQWWHKTLEGAKDRKQEAQNWYSNVQIIEVTTGKLLDGSPD